MVCVFCFLSSKSLLILWSQRFSMFSSESFQLLLLKDFEYIFIIQLLFCVIFLFAYVAEEVWASQCRLVFPLWFLKTLSKMCIISSLNVFLKFISEYRWFWCFFVKLKNNNKVNFFKRIWVTYVFLEERMVFYVFQRTFPFHLTFKNH